MYYIGDVPPKHWIFSHALASLRDIRLEDRLKQRTLTHFKRRRIPVWQTSCLTGLDSAALLMLNQQQIYLFGQIKSSQTGGQQYSDTSPYEVCEFVPCVAVVGSLA